MSRYTIYVVPSEFQAIKRLPGNVRQRVKRAIVIRRWRRVERGLLCRNCRAYGYALVLAFLVPPAFFCARS